jgi:hypothetical protein
MAGNALRRSARTSEDDAATAASLPRSRLLRALPDQTFFAARAGTFSGFLPIRSIYFC